MMKKRTVGRKLTISVQYRMEINTAIDIDVVNYVS